MVRPGNLLDVRPQAIVAASERELFGAFAELNVRVDLRNLTPRDTDSAAAAQPGGDPSEHAGAAAPDAGTTQNREPLELLSGAALELEIIDLPAAAVLRVE